MLLWLVTEEELQLGKVDQPKQIRHVQRLHAFLSEFQVFSFEAGEQPRLLPRGR